MTTVKRSDITITEEVGYEFTFSDKNFPETLYWVAELNGYLSTGEGVTVSRLGGTFSEAKNALEELISEQGWSIE